MSDVDVIAKIEASVDDGGWQASGVVIGDADKIDFDQEIDVWFDLYTSAGWEALPRPAFRGHLIPDTWQKTFQSSVAPFSAFTAQGFMKRGRVQGIYFKNVASSPANDHQIVGMTYAAIVEHTLGKAGEYGHCNLVKDVWPEGIVRLNIDNSNSSSIDNYEVKEGNFWSRHQEVAEIDRYWLYVDRTNTVNFIPHPMFGTLPTPVLEITNSLLLEPLRITRRHTEQIGQVKLDGRTPAGLQITGVYPTDPQPGIIVTKAGYMATSDANMDTVAERIYKFETRGYTVEAMVAGAVGLMLDLMDRISITYSSSADGISWSEKKFWVHKIVVELLKNFTTRTMLTLEAENS